MKLFPFIFKAKHCSSWGWPTCTNSLKTLSFRLTKGEYSPTHLQECDKDAIESDDDPKPVLSNADEDKYYLPNDDEYAVIKGLRSSDRLFFEPGNTSSILEEEEEEEEEERAAKPSFHNSFSSSRKGCNNHHAVSILEVESTNPMVDFKASMEEMVESQGLKSWDSLEKLLARYLRVNEKNNHGYVIEAFVGLVLGLGLDYRQVGANRDYADDDCSTSNSEDVNNDDDDDQGSCLTMKNNVHKCSLTSPNTTSYSSSSCCGSSTSRGLSSLRNLIDNEDSNNNIVDDDKKNLYSLKVKP